MGDFLNSYIKEIEKNLKNSKIRIEYFDTLTSTNALLKEKAKTEKEGLLIIAEGQTAGRGRFSRRFYSPENSGIYMSLLLKPKLIGFNATFITTACAVAVARAAENLSGKKTQIKWVNDVLIGGKKICGILTEGSFNPENGAPEYIVLGIGINAFTPKNGFEKEIKEIAGGVFENSDISLKAKLTAEVINIFMDYYDNLSDKAFLEDYRKRSFILGKNITVIKGQTKTPAKAISIDDDCRLLVEYENLSQEYLSSGEISIRVP